MCCHGNAACLNNRTCCTMGECNCACMPVQKALWPFISLFFEHFLCCFFFSFFCCFHPPSNFLTSVFPDTAFLAFVVSFSLCCVYSVCVFFLSFRTSLFLRPPPPTPPPLPLLRFLSSLCGSFVCEVCVYFLFLKLMLLCFLTHGVQMQMPNEMISVYTASVPVILFTAGRY